MRHVADVFDNLLVVGGAYYLMQIFLGDVAVLNWKKKNISRLLMKALSSSFISFVWTIDLNYKNSFSIRMSFSIQ